MAVVGSFTSPFVARLSEKFPEYQWDIEAGQKYDRITQTRGQFGGKSVHAFVTKDGKLVKAGTWKAPQRSLATGELAVRFDLADEAGFAEACEQADAHGGYLYVR